jgi:hypothetical protein
MARDLDVIQHEAGRPGAGARIEDTARGGPAEAQSWW